MMVDILCIAIGVALDTVSRTMFLFRFERSNQRRDLFTILINSNVRHF